MNQLTERIYTLPHDDTTDRPTLGYIRGDRYSLMVDAGNSPDHAALFARGLEALHLSAPDFVALTHWHWDHTFALSALPAVSLACSRTNEQLAAMQNWEWTSEAMERRVRTGEDIEFVSTMIAKEYPDLSKIEVRTADALFEDSLRVDLGGVSCLLTRLDGPHSTDSVLLYVPQEKVVFLGDAAYGSGYAPALCNKQSMGALISLLRGLDFSLAVWGHNEPMEKKELLQELESDLSGMNG